MKEYIEREALLKIFDDILKYQEEQDYWPQATTTRIAINKICNALAADVVPVVHGQWIEEFRSQISPDGYFYWNTPQKKIYVCSICGREEVKKEPYCNCGARMDGGN